MNKDAPRGRGRLQRAVRALRGPRGGEGDSGHRLHDKGALGGHIQGDGCDALVMYKTEAFPFYSLKGGENGNEAKNSAGKPLLGIK